MPESEFARLEALAASELLDTEPEATFDSLTTLASRIADTPIALFSLVDRDRQWFKARHGLTVNETSRDVAFCAHAILQNGPLIVPDATDDDRFQDNPLVTGSPGIRFYAGFPVRGLSGQPLGTLCVIDDEPRDLSSDQISTLALLADAVSDLIEARLGNLSGERTARLDRLDFLSRVDQDLATTVSGLLAACDELSRSPLSTEQQAHLDLCQDSLGHILALFDQISLETSG